MALDEILKKHSSLFSKPEEKVAPAISEPTEEPIKPVEKKVEKMAPLPTVGGYEKLSPNVKKTLEHDKFESLSSSMEDLDRFNRLYSRSNKGQGMLDLAKNKGMYGEGDKSLFITDFTPIVKNNEDLKLAAKIVASKKGWKTDGTNENLAEFLYHAGPKTLGEVQAKFFEKARSRVMDSMIKKPETPVEKAKVIKAQKFEKPISTDGKKPLDIRSMYKKL